MYYYVFIHMHIISQFIDIDRPPPTTYSSNPRMPRCHDMLPMRGFQRPKRLPEAGATIAIDGLNEQTLVYKLTSIGEPWKTRVKQLRNLPTINITTEHRY
jgi:hypothetical protein